MKITVTGASGLIGKPLVERLRSEGHAVTTLGRAQWNLTADEPPEAALAGAEAIIHLAGEPVAQRWTPAVKKAIRDTRTLGTRHLVHALSTRSDRPKVFISASATGVYGDRGDQVLTESAKPGQGFLAEVALEWEKEAQMAESLGIRVVLLRTGVVLAKQGGALEKMLPPFRMGAGGKLASGKQWMSWIHLEDEIELIRFALNETAVRGPLNAVSPQPLRNEDFTKVLAKAIHRPAFFPVPKLALQALYGEMSDVLLDSQRVLPQAAQTAGFRFRYADLAACLANILA